MSDREVALKFKIIKPEKTGLERWFEVKSICCSSRRTNLVSSIQVVRLTITYNSKFGDLMSSLAPWAPTLIFI